ncbi:MAG: hypothetical protein EBY29_12790 [Planctomycetes bacterium]|nr:hypothetical protein [Planctomycetota bacterium]
MRYVLDRAPYLLVALQVGLIVPFKFSRWMFVQTTHVLQQAVAHSVAMTTVQAVSTVVQKSSLLLRLDENIWCV